METQLGQYVRSLNAPSSQPTYKEWKHHEDVLQGRIQEGSQPTYKEWKQIIQSCEVGERAGSQPTYKEWKLEKQVGDVCAVDLRSQPTYKEWKL